jgi:hypothetical protein
VRGSVEADLSLTEETGHQNINRMKTHLHVILISMALSSLLKAADTRVVASKASGFTFVAWEQDGSILLVEHDSNGKINGNVVARDKVGEITMPINQNETYLSWLALDYASYLMKIGRIDKDSVVFVEKARRQNGMYQAVLIRANSSEFKPIME